MKGPLCFTKNQKVIHVRTENFSEAFIKRAVTYAIRRRIQGAKTIVQAERIAKAFSDGQWDMPCEKYPSINWHN